METSLIISDCSGSGGDGYDGSKAQGGSHGSTEQEVTGKLHPGSDTQQLFQLEEV